MGQPTISQPSPFGQDVDLRSVGAMDPRLANRQQMPPANMDFDMRSMPMGMNYDQRPMQQAPPPQRQFPADPRQRGSNSDPRDPRQKAQQQQHQQQSSSSSLAAQLHRGISNDASDQEKAALIMQVLKLTDEQIAILPPEQRASILVLKEQIAKSAMK
jgi:cleavage stimulation factor subunit 2